MADENERIIRRHKHRSDDGKGLRRLIAGKRFRLPAGVSSQEADQRFLMIERLWRDNEAFCHKIDREAQWTDIALWAAEKIRHGVPRIPVPPIDDILASYGESPWPMNIRIIVDRFTDETLRTRYPATVDGLDWDEARTFFDNLSDAFPSVNWLLPSPHSDSIIASHEQQARWSIDKLAQAQNQAPPDPSTPLIIGTFHEALAAFEANRTDGFTTVEGFDNSGHHMIGMIRKMRERMPDFLLVELDLKKCQVQFDYWRNRPRNLKIEEPTPLSFRTCENYVGELGRFFEWLHLSSAFAWRKPVDFDSLERSVKPLNSDRRSINEMEVLTFSAEDLVVLMKYATRFERLLLVWCLNCSHGAAEMGRVEWGDIFLRREHPWKKQGLHLETTAHDSWCGFIRPKSDVLGWWFLWPETVQLLEWWKDERRKVRGGEPPDEERVLITDNGHPLYREASGNAQTGFANAWNRLLKRIEKTEGKGVVRCLPFGTLRDQLSDWLGGEEAKAVVASVALCHGIPHKGDKLLYGRYSNRPWRALFQSQREYRQHLSSVFDAVPDVLAEYDPVGDNVMSLWESGIRSCHKIAGCLDVSEMTVRRRLQSLGLKPNHESAPDGSTADQRSNNQ